MLKQLSEYRKLTKEFGQSVMSLKLSIKREDSVKFKIIHKFSTSGYDCLYAFDIAAEYSIYLLDKDNEWKSTEKLDPLAENRPKHYEVKRLELMYKSLFYFLRVFQDEANRLLLELIGEKGGPNSSMSKSLKNEKNPISIMLTEVFPEYNEWFLDLRERRNKIKSYGDFDSNFDGNDIQMRFMLVDEGDKKLNERNDALNVLPVNFGEYFEDAILKCIKLNGVISTVYFQQFHKDFNEPITNIV